MSNPDFGWSQKELSQLVVFSKGKKVDTNKEILPNYLRYLGASGIEGKDDGFGDPVEGVIANENDILMLWDGERSGLVGIGQTGVVASTVSRLRVNLELLAPKFLYYLFQLRFNYIQQQRTGTGVPHVPKDLKTIFLVKYPDDIRQQQKIAKILSTVDNLIEQTQALIEKYTAIKQGMMADLFTRGIDLSGTPETNPNHGQLRPSFEEAPELYKETELGWVPRNWDLHSALELCSKIIDCKNRTPPELDEGFAVIKTSNIKQGHLVLNTLTFTDGPSYEIWTQRGEPTIGDVVITREAPVGESFLILNSMPKMCLGQRMMLYRPDCEKILPEFLYWSTRSAYLQRRLIELAGGSTVGHVRVGDIRDLLLKVPVLKEQKEIFLTIDAIDDKINLEKKTMAKLQKQKKGLMQDLLTGKVRVNA